MAPDTAIDSGSTPGTGLHEARQATPLSAWFTVANAREIPTPALLFYPDRIEENIRRMTAMTGDPARLRPHMKTHKTREIIALQVRRGITKCKCATASEAEVAALGGATDILLALQPAGPAVRRLLDLAERFPEARFSSIVDDPEAVRQLGDAASARGRRLPVWVDINSGMNRTGIVPGDGAFALYRLISETPSLEAAGLHVYDGHIREQDPAARRELCDAAFAPVERLAARLQDSGMPVPAIVAGGTPVFPFHAGRTAAVEPSPGTTLLWDESSRSGYSDLHFRLAALVLTRVISKPAPGLLCLDLGHKSVASEMPHPRARLFAPEDARAVAHSEEHMVLETVQADRWHVGDCLYAVPTHICPTVSCYERAYTVHDGRADGEWPIAARNRVL